MNGKDWVLTFPGAWSVKPMTQRRRLELFFILLNAINEIAIPGGGGGGTGMFLESVWVWNCQSV